jgi:FkbM family methyltransferase
VLLNRLLLRLLLATSDDRRLEELERLVRVKQGKGWGAGTVDHETQTAIGLLPPERRDRPVILDIGANVGAWTAAALAVAPDAVIHAFEPSAAAFESLTESFADDPRVRTHQLALGASAGQAELFADVAGSGLASLTRRRLDHHDITFDKSELVSLDTVDAWSARNGVSADLMKIDVEGHELDVLAGATTALATVAVVQFEFGGCNIDTRTYFQDFFYFFTERGFALHRIHERGITAVPHYSEIHENFGTTNFLAIRKG